MVGIYEIVCWVDMNPVGLQCAGWRLKAHSVESGVIHLDKSMRGRLSQVDERRRLVGGQMVMG
jgi:hypothetical protein